MSNEGGVAVVTSGGDSQGMNATYRYCCSCTFFFLFHFFFLHHRSVCRSSITRGWKVFAIHDGFKGLLLLLFSFLLLLFFYLFSGLIDNNIERVYWSSVGSIMNRGGTVLGTARCKEFRFFFIFFFYFFFVFFFLFLSIVFVLIVTVL